MSISSIHQSEMNEKQSETSMTTIKEIITCLPKPILTRNKRNSFLFTEDYNNYTSHSTSSNLPNKNLTQEKRRGSNKFYMDSYSYNSSCSSSCSGQIDNISKIVGQQDYNYQTISNKIPYGEGANTSRNKDGGNLVYNIFKANNKTKSNFDSLENFQQKIAEIKEDVNKNVCKSNREGKTKRRYNKISCCFFFK